MNHWYDLLVSRQVDNNISEPWMRFSDQEAFHSAISSRAIPCRLEILNNEIWNATDIIWMPLLKLSRFDDIKILHSKLTTLIDFDSLFINDNVISHLFDYPGYEINHGQFHD